jgi:hypothetical protein
MGARPEDVAIRLSPQGLDDVSRAFKTILGDINRTGRAGQNAFGPLKTIANDLKRLLPAIGFAAAATGLTAMARSALNAADAVGKTAQKVGATAESISILQFASATADVTNEQLESGLIKLAKSMGDATDGAAAQVNAFRALGLEASELQKLDTGKAFALIAEKLGTVTDSSKKTKIALDIFGKSGAQLIPLLNDLAVNGYDKTRESAEKFGLVISSDTAAAAQAANDSLTTIGLQAKGLATAFITGFAPSIADAMQTFTDATAGDGVESMKKFGVSTGRVLRGLIGIFRLFGNFVTGIFKTIGNVIGGTLAAIVSAFKGEFSEAIDILKNVGTDAFDNARETFAQGFEDFDRLVDDVNRDPPEIKVKVKPEVDFGDFETVEKEKARNSAKSKADKEAEAAAKKKQAAEEKAAQALLDLQQQLSELQGKTSEAQISKLNEEIDKRKKILEQAGMLNAETQKLLDDVQRLGTAKINFEDTQDQIERQLDAFQKARDQIQSDIETGIESEFGGQQRLRQLYLERIPILRELATLLKQQGDAVGSQEVLDQIEAVETQINELDNSLKIATDTALKFKQGVGDALQQSLENILNGTTEVESIGDAFKQLRNTAVQALRDIASEILATFIRAQLLKAIQAIGGGLGGGGGIGGGAPVAAAGGGLITGPGTSTSDSIPAWLSDGEHVTRAKAVEAPGVLPMLQYINRHARLPKGAPRFAGGGTVGKPAGSSKSSGESGGLRIINVLDPSLVTAALGTPAAEKVIMNTIQRNASGVRRFIGDASR